MLSKILSSHRTKLIIVPIIIISVIFTSVPAFAEMSNDSNFGTYSYDKEKLKAMQKTYELTRSKYNYTHKALAPLSKISKPRYRLKSDGIYKSKSVEKDGIATIMITGDLMCQRKQQDAAKKKYGKYKFNDSFYYERSILKSADFVVGNLETTLSELSYMSEEKTIDGHANCNAPSTYLDALKYAGFDMLAMANNHNLDGGIKGIYQTIAHVNQYGFIHTGLYEDIDEPRFVIAEIDGIKVGFVSYSTLYNQRDKYLTKDAKEVFLSPYSYERVARDVSAAKEAGAEYIIGFIHWGIEYETKESAEQTNIAYEMANSGVDFIIGSHPHVLQPYDYIYSNTGKKVHVMYSMGNHISQMVSHDECRDSIILRLKLKKNDSGKVVLAGKCYIPERCVIKYNKRNYPVMPLTTERLKSSSNKKNFRISHNRIEEIIGAQFPVPLKYRLK